VNAVVDGERVDRRGSVAFEGASGGLTDCLAQLDVAIEAASTLGIPTAAAEAVRREANERLGFPSDAYVLALVGGTGVGKSSLLNALAGSAVSPASVRRPTTSHPIAWVPREARPELGGMLDWLGVPPDSASEHDERQLAGVAILDLPDLDSTDPAHRERVESILPRVDAVAWVTDPEKYHDAILHDDFLRTWIPRLDRQIVILNKADRLSSSDAERVRRDLEAAVTGAAGPGATGGRRTRVILASARGAVSEAAESPGTPDGSPGVDELRAWLAAAVEAKQVVRARLAASISAAITDLAAAAGIHTTTRARPILDPAARRSAIDRATAALLRVVDLPAVERQAVAATRARARARGAGPLGAVTSRIYRLSGREARVADPAGFLARWRDRGSLAPALDAIRGSVTTALAESGPATRPAIAATIHPALMERGLAGAVDRAIASRGREAPTSRIWAVIGLLQTVATLALVVAGLWVALWLVVKFPVDSVAVPVLGQLPVPFVFLVGALLAGYVIARLLGAHAGWVGRRWANRLASEVRSNVAREVESVAFEGLDRLEAARRALWQAARSISEACSAG
jgi:hypothetical protein